MNERIASRNTKQNRSIYTQVKQRKTRAKSTLIKLFLSRDIR